MKITLNTSRQYRPSERYNTLTISHSLPWFKAPAGRLYHLVRRGVIFINKNDGTYSHAAITYACGNSGYPSSGPNAERCFFENALMENKCRLCVAKQHHSDAE